MRISKQGRRFIAALVLLTGLSSCASYEKLEISTTGCLEEECIGDRMRDISVPDAERYLSTRRALEKGFQPHQSPSSFWQYYATLAGFVGDYDASYNVLTAPKSKENPVADGFKYVTRSIPTIVALARKTRAVFVNEAHTFPQTRAAIFSLLAPLRAEGFNTLALEGLTMSPAPSGSGCADSVVFDKELNTRGFPLRKTGFYVREPILAEIIREAIRLGYTVVGYETTDYSARSIEHREQKQAENLACVVDASPSVKLLVVAGYSHISEGDDSRVPGGWMAARFKKITGIDPLTLDTTKLLGVERNDLIRHGTSFELATLDSTSAGQPYLLSNDSAWLYGDDRFDLMLVLNRFAGRDEPDSSWLELGGTRRRTAVSALNCKSHFPCIVEAYANATPGSDIPADSCVVTETDATCNLFLAPGGYQIRFISADAYRGEVISLSVPQ